MVMPVTAPLRPDRRRGPASATIAGGAGSMVTIASAMVNGLLAQFGKGP